MKRHWLRWGVAGILLLCVATFALLFGFDGESVKQQLIKQVRETTQRELRIDGPLKLDLLPRLALEASDISLSGPSGQGEFLRVGELKGAVDILPLLLGQVVINRIEVRDARLKLMVDAAGQSNFEDLMRFSQGNEKSSVRADLDRLVLLGGELDWRDLRTGRQLQLKEVYVRTGHLGPQAQGKLELGGQLLDSATEAQINLGFETLYRLETNQGLLQLDGVKARSRGSVGPVKNARFEVDASRWLLSATDMSAEFQNLALQGEGLLKAQTWTARMTIPAGKFSEAQSILEQPQLTLGSGEGDRLSANLKFKAGLFLGSKERWRLDEFQSEGTYKREELQASLQVAGNPEFFPASKQLNSGSLSGGLTITSPSLLKQALEIRMSSALALDIQAAKGKAELQADMDSSQLKSVWALEQRDGNLYVSGNAQLNQIDLDQYLLEADKQTPKKGGLALPKIAFPTAPVKAPEGTENTGLQLDGQVKIGLLQWHQMKLERLESRISYRQGELKLDPLTLQLYQGKAKGGLAWDSNAGRFQVRQSFSRVALAPLLKDLTGVEALAGTGTMDLQLTGLANQRDSWEGGATLKVGKGSLRGVNLTALQDLLGEAELSRQLSSQEISAFSELSARLDIKNGLMTNDDLSIKSSSFLVKGEGQLNLVSEQLDYLLRVQPRKRTQALLPNMPGVVVPLRLTGPLQQVQYQVDAVALSQQLGLPPVSVGSSNEGPLKGLFRRVFRP